MSTDPKILFKTCRQLFKGGEADKATEQLCNALRLGNLGADDTLHAGRLLKQYLVDSKFTQAHKVRLLGQCTTSWLVPALTAIAAGRGTWLQVDEADYDNVLQDLSYLSSIGHFPEVLVLLPWHQRLFSGSRDFDTRINDEVAFWQNVWQLIPPDVRLVQVGYDWLDTRSSGFYTPANKDNPANTVRKLNQELQEVLPQGAYFVDIEKISGFIGRNNFYDARSYFWTKQPYSDQGIVHLGKHIWAGIRAITTGPKKALVLDLDNTLWGGVVGEVGPLGVDLGSTPAGEAYKDFQTLIKGLQQRGCILAVCSKNNPEDARAPFEKNADMVLKLEDFSAFEAGWGPKPKAVQSIAERLNIGLDSIVYFDDEPAEREIIRQHLPAVEVVDVPLDPAEYRQALHNGLWFESISLTNEDRQRTQLYKNEQERQKERASSLNLDEYLASLEMKAQLHCIDDGNLERVVQLIGKTNQFNLTTRRHARAEVIQLISNPGSAGLALSLSDRFGDYGLIAVLITQDITKGNDRRILKIDTWLMSCRVIGRSVEHFLFNKVLEIAREKHFHIIEGEFIPTSKNALVKDLYVELGFRCVHQRADGSAVYELEAGSARPMATFVAAPKSAT